jgi:hypothetical protein
VGLGVKIVRMKRIVVVVVAAAIASACVDANLTRPDDPRPTIGHGIPVASAPPPAVGTWTALANRPPISAALTILLTDGTVMAQGLESSMWYRLSPDTNGNYINGSWKQLASMPNGYSPLYYASGVLLDGRVVIQGGEYDGGAMAETTRGAIYDPVADSWTLLAAPSGWTSVGDASGLVLGDGRLLLANCCTNQQALLDPKTLTYSQTGTGKADANSEESWALLWDGTVLTTDIFAGGTSMNAEIYDPATGAWSAAGSTVVLLHDGGFEIGPMIVRPDGTVLATGATGHNAIYNQLTKTWAAGPDLPMVGGKQVDIADGPGALLPNGNVLVAASPGDYMPPLSFFEFDGTAFNAVAGTPNATSDTSYQINFTVLPSGQILESDFSSDLEIYTPAPGNTDAWAPIIISLPRQVTATSPRSATPPPPDPTPLPLVTLHHGQTYEVWVKRMNGLSQGSYYGDDASSAANFPLLRVTNNATGHVMYARTHDMSTRQIGPQVEATTRFDLPATVEIGSSTIQVVANGIASPAVAVEVD